MNKLKEQYCSPTTNILVVRFGESILVISGGANYSSRAGGAGGDDAFDDGESF